jgi:hypothetical protein
MKITLDIPDQMADDLAAQSHAAKLEVDRYAAELLAQAVENRQLGAAALLDQRPAWPQSRPREPR